MRIHALPVLPVLALVVLPSCVHQLEIVNPCSLDSSEITRTTPRRVAIAPFEGKDEDRPYFEHVVRGLESHPSVEAIRTNWTPGSAGPDFRPDAVVSITPQASYEGSGLNFLITFPGFLVFAHAWHGYIYYGQLTTDYEVRDASGVDVLKQSRLEDEFEMHHCDFGRGFWASTGWWTPGYGLVTIIPAIYMITYDDDATSDFQKELRLPWGDYMAETIVRDVVKSLDGDSGARDEKISSALQ